MNIENVQRILKAQGLYADDVDGENGPNTKAAIMAFQALKGLDVDGEVGPKTAAALAALDSSASSTDTPPPPPPAPAPAGIIPRVVDIYHGDSVSDFHPAANAGLWGVIHKSSQGISFADHAYDDRRQLAIDAGLLWGAYHFNSADKVSAQVDFFMKTAQPDDNTLMVLDFEENAKSPMSVQHAVEFLHLLEEKLGRKGAIYSGNRIKETIESLSDEDQQYVTSHRLWLCQYSNHFKLPTGWDKYFLWQYTGDGLGQKPHYVPGITVPGGNGIDLNIYDGTQDQLKAEWR